MKRLANLYPKIVTFENLLLAAKRATRGKKAKNSVISFAFNLENELILLKQQLESHSYRPRPYSQFEVKEPKVRKICSSDFRDRVVHHAICNFLEPIIERRSIFDSYACRNGKGAHLAVSRCQEFSRKFKYYLKCDIKKFFESIDHQILKNILQRMIKDSDLFWLLDIIIDHKVPGNADGKGLPIGNLTSQHFANLYLGELDHLIKDRIGIKGYIRYMDDFICFADSKKELWNLLSKIDEFVTQALALELKAKVTQIAPVSEGIPFLGFRVFPQIIRIKRENLSRMKNKIRSREIQFKKGHISERDLINSVGSIVAHVSHVNSLSIRRSIFRESLNMV
ncbi:MAG: RNA-dependent DNA polymerase [Bdellovibrionales bacterium]|nr:RNA-dependent DNA polymerase [Bdellovibrionales bacterium]